jgi:hypothetical protein
VKVKRRFGGTLPPSLGVDKKDKQQADMKQTLRKASNADCFILRSLL